MAKFTNFSRAHSAAISKRKFVLTKVTKIKSAKHFPNDCCVKMSVQIYPPIPGPKKNGSDCFEQSDWQDKNFQPIRKLKASVA